MAALSLSEEAAVSKPQIQIRSLQRSAAGQLRFPIKGVGGSANGVDTVLQRKV